MAAAYFEGLLLNWTIQPSIRSHSIFTSTWNGQIPRMFFIPAAI
jgi:hypothetical protein